MNRQLRAVLGLLLVYIYSGLICAYDPASSSEITIQTNLTGVSNANQIF